MHLRTSSSWLFLAIGALLTAVLPACSRAPATSSLGRYQPTPEQAIRALRASLQAWVEGHPTGSITTVTPRVETSDSYRNPDRPLRSFEIVGPVGADDLRQFAVRLTLDNPAEDQTVRYIVIGTNPIWVFRAEDYERISHWEHKMEGADSVSEQEPASPQPDSSPKLAEP